MHDMPLIMQAYALWLSKYGRVGGAVTFDIVDIQLYEGFSRAGEAIVAGGMSPSDYLTSWVRALQRGWTVDFGRDPAVQWPSSTVRVNATQLVVGFSRGSLKLPHEKSLFIPPAEVRRAWTMLLPEERPRGVMFWNMEIDGGPCWYPNGTSVNTSFARQFNAFLHTRKT